MGRPEGVQTFREWDFDNFKFVIHELFLYCIAAFLKHEDFAGVASRVSNRYFAAKNLTFARHSMVSFHVLRPHLKSLEYRNSRLKLRRQSLYSDLLKQRCIATGVSFEQVMQADFLLFLRDCLDAVRDEISPQRWFPYSLLYFGYGEQAFEIFARAESTEYFESLKPILGIEKKEEFQGVFEAIKTKKLWTPTWETTWININTLMGYDALATRP